MTLGTALVGRDEELQSLLRWLSRNDSALIVGAPGSGKSALARAAMAQVGDRFPDQITISTDARVQQQLAHLAEPASGADRLLFIDDADFAPPGSLAMAVEMARFKKHTLLLAGTDQQAIQTALGESSWPRWIEVQLLDELPGEATASLLRQAGPTLSAAAIRAIGAVTLHNPRLIHLVAPRLGSLPPGAEPTAEEIAEFVFADLPLDEHSVDTRDAFAVLASHHREAAALWATLGRHGAAQYLSDRLSPWLVPFLGWLARKDGYRVALADGSAGGFEGRGDDPQLTVVRVPEVMAWPKGYQLDIALRRQPLADAVARALDAGGRTRLLLLSSDPALAEKLRTHCSSPPHRFDLEVIGAANTGIAPGEGGPGAAGADAGKAVGRELHFPHRSFSPGAPERQPALQQEWSRVLRQFAQSDVYSRWALSSGLKCVLDVERTASLISLETLDKPPSSLLSEWLGRWAEHGATAPRPTHVPAADDLADRVAAELTSLLGSLLDAFLKKELPDGKGEAALQIQEWIIRERWRDSIAAKVADWAGRGSLGAFLEARGIPYTDYEDGPALAGRLLERLGVPPRPRVPGPRPEFQQRRERLRALNASLPDVNFAGLQADLQPLFPELETALMETIVAFADAIPAYGDRCRSKMADFRVTGGDLRSQVVELDLGRLISLLGSLLKRASPGGPWAADLGRLRICSVSWARAKSALEALRERRRDWVHGGKPVSRDDAEARLSAREAIDAFLELADSGFGDLLPPVAVVTGLTRDAWGSHAELVDEEGKDLRAYRVELSADSLGRRFYLLSPVNPHPVRPRLVPALPFKNS